MESKTMATPAEVRWRYMFNIEAAAKSQWVGESPRGERVDIQYLGGSVSTDKDRYFRDWWEALNGTQRTAVQGLLTECGFMKEGAASDASNIFAAVTAFRTMEPGSTETPDQRKRQEATLAALRDGQVTPLQWFGFGGDVVSGSDWATLRPDVVAEFSGRLTFRSGDEDRALIDAVFSGVVDLCTAEPDKALSDPRKAVLVKVTENVEPPPRQILLAVTFDVGKAAQRWAPKRYARQAEGFWKYQRLTQGQFIAVGEAGVANDTKLQVDTVKLSVYEVRPVVAVRHRKEDGRG